MKVTDRRAVVGGCGLSFPALSFGAGPIGNLMHAVSDADAREAVEQALLSGMTYLDTSPFYGAGLSEHRLGAALRSHDRNRYLLSTKVGRLLKPGNDLRRAGAFVQTLPFTPEFDYSHRGAIRSFEDSLQRLGMSKVDILYIHDLSPLAHGDQLDMRVEEVLRGAYPALSELRQSGVVSAIGLAVSDWRVCMRLAERGAKFDVFLLACRYTLLDQEPLQEFLPFCHRNGIGVVAAAPFVSGVLAAGSGPGSTYFYSEAPPEVLDRVRRIEQVCARHNVPLPAAAMQMPYGHPAIVSVLIGCRTAREVVTNSTNFELSIPGEFWSELVDQGLIDPKTPFPGAAA